MITQKKNHRWKQLLIMLVTLSLLPFFPLKGFADTESELNFFVTPILPESQLEGGASGYFDLNLGAGQVDSLGLNLQNSSDQDIVIEITAHTASTNVNGVVEYGKDAPDPDPTLPASLDELIETPNEITLSGNERRTIELPLTMPEEEFNGVLAGGIRVREVKADEEQTEEGEGVAITNAFSYVIGVVVSNSRSVTEPDLELLDVFADQLNYRNVFSAQIQNFTPTFVNKMEVEATVRAEGESDILYEAKQTGMQMAPNSHFNFPVSLEGDRFRSGTYVMDITARSEGQEWTWGKVFTVEADDARRLNREDVTIVDGTNWWVIAAISTIFVLGSVLFYVLYKQKKGTPNEGLKE
ncbi:hypothetical protein IGJ74_000822 [Enterococcus sp. AZ009]|uniref:DUF916 and DUF3324 domain-containing protein n=1 Tax=Enterococcus TaxID=1350 RepID=UPI001C460018|nr:DUF916 and DUF3324 domain-containing protein [Enterococcus casseliflavus]